MAIVDDLRKTLSDPTPLYAVAGTVDLTAAKLRQVPAFIEKLRAEAPQRLAAARTTDPKAVQEKFAYRAKEVQAKFTEIVSSIDVKHLRETAQEFALQQVNRAAEAAVKARETYDELAERGRGVVNNLRGEAADEVVDMAAAIEPGQESGSDDASRPGARRAPAARKAPVKRNNTAK